MKIHLAVIFILVSACSTFDRAPVAPATHIPVSAIWSQIIDREVLYIPRPNKIVNEGVSETEYTFSHSVNALFSKGPVAVVYENYSNPFSLKVKIDLLEKDTEEIVFKSCVLKPANGNEMNLLSQTSDYAVCRKSEEGNVRWSERTMFAETYTVDLQEDEFGPVDFLSLYFPDIHIDFETNADFVLQSTFVIRMKNGKHFEITHDNTYTRKIIETRMYHFLRNPSAFDENSVKEITLDEWKTYQ